MIRIHGELIQHLLKRNHEKSNGEKTCVAITVRAHGASSNVDRLHVCFYGTAEKYLSLSPTNVEADRA